jgi:hypothetical protein
MEAIREVERWIAITAAAAERAELVLQPEMAVFIDHGGEA